jgi:hypothetical protein
MVGRPSISSRLMVKIDNFVQALTVSAANDGNSCDDVRLIQQKTVESLAGTSIAILLLCWNQGNPLSTLPGVPGT